ncbi:MAG: ATPase, T2SS/T4P/T4SS family, partial [Polyangiaceae bacterium]
MSGWTRLLAALAIALFVVAVGTLASRLDAISIAALQAAVVEHGHRVFAEPAWRWVLSLGVLGAGLAAALTVLDSLLSVRRAPRPPTFSEMSGSTLEEALTQTAKRVTQCATESNVIALFDELLRGAVRTRASDIHISPGQAGVRLTLRVEGTLHEVSVVPVEIAPLLATRVKVMARLDTVAKTPQDGRLVTYLDAGAIEARVSTLPTETGERVVLRIVRGSREVFDLEGLGFSADLQGRLEGVLARPQGLLFVTGPVGTGKTTTLYACLKHIARTRSK